MERGQKLKEVKKKLSNLKGLCPFIKVVEVTNTSTDLAVYYGTMTLMQLQVFKRRYFVHSFTNTSVSKKNFSPIFYFIWTNCYERLITQQYYHLLFLGLVRIPVLHNLFWWKPLVFLENRRFSKTLVIYISFSFLKKQKVF